MDDRTRHRFVSVIPSAEEFVARLLARPRTIVSDDPIHYPPEYDILVNLDDRDQGRIRVRHYASPRGVASPILQLDLRREHHETVVECTVLSRHAPFSEADRAAQVEVDFFAPEVSAAEVEDTRAAAVVGSRYSPSATELGGTTKRRGEDDVVQHADDAFGLAVFLHSGRALWRVCAKVWAFTVWDLWLDALLQRRAVAKYGGPLVAAVKEVAAEGVVAADPSQSRAAP